MDKADLPTAGASPEIQQISTDVNAGEKASGHPSASTVSNSSVVTAVVRLFDIFQAVKDDLDSSDEDEGTDTTRKEENIKGRGGLTGAGQKALGRKHNHLLDDARSTSSSSGSSGLFSLSEPALSSWDLNNSEESPYGWGETVESLGMKLWGYQPNAKQSLRDLVLAELALPLRSSLGAGLDWNDPEDVLLTLSLRGLITFGILDIFRGLGITALNLTPTLSPDPAQISETDPSSVLRAFQLPHSYIDLCHLCLAGVPLEDADVAYLNSLRLYRLDLSATGISSEATAHLVVMKRTLRILDLHSNPKIRHCASYNLACLVNLQELDVDGTGLKVLSLQHMVRKLAPAGKKRSALRIRVPACCRRYLATMANKYQPFIPQPFVHMGTLGKLRSLPYRAVRKNLEFHRETDCSVSLAGTVDEMAARLKKLLKTRDVDMKLKQMASNL